jgi:hypothetical protein
MADIKTIGLFALVAGIVLFIYFNTPAENDINIPIGSQQTDTSPRSISQDAFSTEYNTTRISGNWYGNIVGDFQGTATVASNTSIINMRGQYSGKCQIRDAMQYCMLNVSKGDYSGLFDSTLDPGGVAHITNMRGSAIAWDIEGFYGVKSTVTPVPSGFNNMILIVVAAVIIILGYGYLNKEESWQVLDAYQISEKARTYLFEKFGLKMKDIVDIAYVDKENPKWIHIHLRLEEPAYESVLMEYDMTKRKFTRFTRRAMHSDVKEFLAPKLKYAEERGAGRSPSFSGWPQRTPKKTTKKTTTKKPTEEKTEE